MAGDDFIGNGWAFPAAINRNGNGAQSNEVSATPKR